MMELVPMVLNPNVIEPTFLKLDSWFNSYYNLQCIKLDEGKKIQEKKSVLCIQKTFNAVFKNGFNSTSINGIFLGYESIVILSII